MDARGIRVEQVVWAIHMNKNITIGAIALAIFLGGLASLALVELLVGEFGMILLSFVGMIYIGRKIYADLFGDLDDDDLVDDL